MLKSEELMYAIVNFGRRDIQEFVARSRDMSDALTYLRVERNLAILKAMSFVTTNSVDFERKVDFPSNPDQATGQNQLGHHQVRNPVFHLDVS